MEMENDRTINRGDEMEASRKRRERGQSGFTLIEIMVVVVIIGMLASLVGVSVIKQLEKAKRKAAAAQIKNFEVALQTYYMDNSQYPTTDQGLQALVSGGGAGGGNAPKQGYLTSIPLDPWNSEYVYFCPGVNGGSDPSIESYGKDGMDGGEGDNADIESWDLSAN